MFERVFYPQSRKDRLLFRAAPLAVAAMGAGTLVGNSFMEIAPPEETVRCAIASPDSNNGVQSAIENAIEGMAGQPGNYHNVVEVGQQAATDFSHQTGETSIEPSDEFYVCVGKDSVTSVTYIDPSMQPADGVTVRQPR